MTCPLERVRAGEHSWAGRQTLHSEMVVTVMVTEVSGGRWPIRRTAKNLAAGKLRAGNREAARQPWAGALGSPGTMVR